MTFKERIAILLGIGEARFDFTLREFSRRNKKLLIIIADPSNDRVYSAYNEHIIQGEIDAQKRVVAGLLKESRYRFKESFIRFAYALSQNLGVDMEGGHFVLLMRQVAQNLKTLIYFNKNYKVERKS